MRRLAIRMFLLLLLAAIGSSACCQEPAADKDAAKSEHAKQIQIKLQVEVTHPAKGKVKEIKEKSCPIVSTIENQPAVISIENLDQDGKLINRVSFFVLPTIAKDGQINISGSVDYILNDFYLKDAKISVSLEPGKPQKLPHIIIPSKHGKENAIMDLTLTAVVIPDTSKQRPVIIAS